jgi:hypothetical protein
MIELIGGWSLFGTQELWILLGILLVVAGRHSLLAWMRRRRQALSTEAGRDDTVVHVARDEQHHVTSHQRPVSDY